MTEEFFAQANRFDIYVSEITIAEIIKTDNSILREKMQSFITPYKILESEIVLNEDEIVILRHQLKIMRQKSYQI